MQQRRRAHQRGSGFTDELITANHIGADPGRRKMRRRRGLPYGNGIAAVFPALDPEGRIQYLQARYLAPGDGPKYDNPAASLGSNPRLAWTRTVGRTRPDMLLVCEGIPDALTAAQAGLRSVAVLGSQAPDQSVANGLAAVAEGQRLTIVAVPDNDEAGSAWGVRLSELLADAGQSLSLLRPSEPGLDLNAWASSDPEWVHHLSRHAELGFDQSLHGPAGVGDSYSSV